MSRQSNSWKTKSGLNFFLNFNFLLETIQLLTQVPLYPWTLISKHFQNFLSCVKSDLLLQWAGGVNMMLRQRAISILPIFGFLQIDQPGNYEDKTMDETRNIKRFFKYKKIDGTCYRWTILKPQTFQRYSKVH